MAPIAHKTRMPCGGCGRSKVCTVFGRTPIYELEALLGLCGECLAYEHDEGWLAAHCPWWADEQGRHS